MILRNLFRPAARMTLLALALAAPASLARAADPASIVSAKRALQSALDQGKVEGLLEAHARFSALASAEPADALLHYWSAVAAWRACAIVGGSNAERARRLAEDGVSHCDCALEAKPEFGEALAVKGGLQGMLIQFGGGDAMTLGPQSGVNLSRAQRLSPGNPRVLLIDGMNMLYRPKAFGGGAAPALEIFVAARDAFASDAPADSTAPDWGRDDAYAWLGRAYSALQKTDEARAAYEMALELNPKNGWVKKVLLPGLEKQPAKGAGQ